MHQGTNTPLASVKVGWASADIRAELHRRGITIKQIADDLNLGRTAVSMVIAGRARTPYVRRHIAVLLGRPTAEIWPESAGWDLDRRSAPRRRRVS